MQNKLPHFAASTVACVLIQHEECRTHKLSCIFLSFCRVSPPSPLQTSFKWKFLAKVCQYFSIADFWSDLHEASNSGAV